MIVFDIGLQGAVEARMVPVWAAIVRAYQYLGTPAREMLPYVLFANLFVHSRTSTPTSYHQLHCKRAQARHCVAALRLVIRDMHEWAPAGSCDDIPSF